MTAACRPSCRCFKCYVFYDTETTGIETAFDQILQFAAIRTDDDLNELGRFNIRCRLLPHIIPSPIALQVTHVTPAMLTDSALPSHYAAAAFAHRHGKKCSTRDRSCRSLLGCCTTGC